ncbi:hypothetical protein [Pseudomonas viridiflava]|uniref:hypothetical protein n=1 Tax=Pseudomonas viridiflava TaxID=33069 RepID=UPI001C318C8B|nr:hypothetical protein [Pseudomonas viridiflava]QXG33666.1 hypothetical protein KTT61_16330 [Pseudomonas viridiflava]
MSTNADSLATLRTLAAGTPLETGIDFLFAQTHEARVTAIQRSVDFACNKLVKHRNKKKEGDEDGLTVQVCDMLASSGIDAIHNASVGGHCDVVIKGKSDFLWLAEAKKHSDYAWLDKGFKQLSTRYSTGNPGQDHGDILIYCFVQDAKAMLEKWKDELIYRNTQVVVSDDGIIKTLTFKSTHKHECSGLDFYVRHKVVSLYWDPKDK